MCHFIEFFGGVKNSWVESCDNYSRIIIINKIIHYITSTTNFIKFHKFRIISKLIKPFEYRYVSSYCGFSFTNCFKISFCNSLFPGNTASKKYLQQIQLQLVNCKQYRSLPSSSNRQYPLSTQLAQFVFTYSLMRSDCSGVILIIIRSLLSFRNSPRYIRFYPLFI